MHIFEKYEDKKNVVLNLKGIENLKKLKYHIFLIKH